MRLKYIPLEALEVEEVTLIKKFENVDDLYYMYTCRVCSNCGEYLGMFRIGDVVCVKCWNCKEFNMVK
uniref:Uncharacterized protein n=1 Tax=viral metagenome TaxID=1070528 RepID=A0A6M3KTJ8_9ZZZZ